MTCSLFLIFCFTKNAKNNRLRVVGGLRCSRHTRALRCTFWEREPDVVPPEEMAFFSLVSSIILLFLLLYLQFPFELPIPG